VDAPTEVSKAAQRALVALADVTALKEGDVAAALGVSRPQANNYRHGKTLLAPTDDQVKAILDLFDGVLNRLHAERDAFEIAILGG
jgi:transcriptional regulator with XRE-family HTH domain